jgi:hypothetical protein
MKIAALVCTLNEEKLIIRRLKNLADLRIPSGIDFSVAILDNGSTDNTCELSELFARETGRDVQVYSLGPIGKCGALYWGFEHLHADIFLLSDANTVFAGDILEVLSDAAISFPKCSLFVGNIRSVANEAKGRSFLERRREPAMPLRLELEQRLGVFSGSNGGCYAVTAEAVRRIWDLQPVRNDDYVISVFASRKSQPQYLRNMRAFEVENFSVVGAFKQKHRDALGHFQALQLLCRNDIMGLHGRVAALVRVLYWTLPLAIGTIAVSKLEFRYLIVVFISFCLHARLRRVIARSLGLYTGFFWGIFKPPPVRWRPDR